MLEINNQAVAGLAYKEKLNDEITELKIQEFNTTSVAMSDQQEKDKITKKSSFAHEKLEVEDRKEQTVDTITQKEK